MTTATDYHYGPFNPSSPKQARRLTEMFEAYLIEEHERTGELASGLPVAFFLQTLIVWADDEAVGFCSVDLGRRSVELIYVVPEYRGKGLARVLLAQLRDTCPEPMGLKAPLTPGGQALADALGLRVAFPEKDEDPGCSHRAINDRCRHKRSNRVRPCPRCYRKGLKKIAASVVGTYAAACWAMTSIGITTHPTALERAR